MKKYLLIIPAFVFAFGCHNYKADIDKLQKEKGEITASAAYKDSSISEFMKEFNQVEENLAAIEKKQTTIAKNSRNNELQARQIDRINDNIRGIADLMKENKEKMANLEKRLKRSGSKLANFEKMVASLNDQVVQKDKQLEEMNVRLTALNTQVDKLNTDLTASNTENEARGKTIDEQTTKLHTAYYTTGTFKELKEKQVLVKEGGVLGLGSQKELKDNFNSKAFTPIDITKVQTIPLQSTGAQLVTNHPSDSYTIEIKGDQVSDLRILDPEKFWATSKYLVVVVDK
jgi:chromosome segregation ATPase